MKDTRLTLADGRKLALTDLGDATGFPVFFFHGAPGSRLDLVTLEAEFAARGLRVISLDRPGYGGSSPQPGRTMAEWPADVQRAADTLGIDDFIVVGYSSGGPYAVACAALLPERVVGAVIPAGVTDMAWSGAWKGLFKPELVMMGLLDEQAVSAQCEKLFGADGSGFLTSPDFELAEPDIALLCDEKELSATVASLEEAFRQGVGGYAQDVFVQGRAWPFALDRITAPVIIAHGELDAVVPLAHSRHAAGLVPGSSLKELPGHGHLTITAELPDLCAELVRQ